MPRKKVPSDVRRHFTLISSTLSEVRALVNLTGGMSGDSKVTVLVSEATDEDDAPDPMSPRTRIPLRRQGFRS